MTEKLLQTVDAGLEPEVYRRQLGEILTQAQDNPGVVYKPTHNERVKAFYAQRRAAGLCCKCGQPSAGKTYCQQCNDKKLAEREKQRQQRAAEGLCFRCALPLEDKTKRHCAECRSKKSRLNMSRYNRHAADAVCRRCGKATEDGAILCGNCQTATDDRRHQRAAERWAAAQCWRCSRPLESLAYRQCRRCRERYTGRRQWAQDWQVAQSLRAMERRIREEAAQARPGRRSRAAGQSSAKAQRPAAPPREPGVALAEGWAVAVRLANAHNCRQCQVFLSKARGLTRQVYAPIRRRMMKRLLRSHEQIIKES